MFHRSLSVLATAALILSLGTVAATTADASQQNPTATGVSASVAPTSAQLTTLAKAGTLTQGQADAGYRQLVAALKDSGATSSNGLVSYNLPGYGEIVLSEPTNGAHLLGGGGAQPLLGGGWDGWSGPYVSFNRVDQGALVAGGAAALAVGICLIPAVGQAACVVAVGLVATAAYYVNAYGMCSGSTPNLREYVWSSNTGCYR